MESHTAHKGRKSSGTSVNRIISITCYLLISGFSSFLKSVLDTSLPMIAVFACGCIKEPGPGCTEMTQCTSIQVKGYDGSVSGHIERADVFTFNADSLGRLDSYQRLENISDGRISVHSTGGRKRIFLCCNQVLEEDKILSISSMEDLEECFCMLEDTRRSSPLMLGSIETDIGNGKPESVILKPMTCEIVLRSIRSNFAGTPYDGEPVTDAKVYLTNVNAQCNICESPRTARRFINIGMLNQEEVVRFREPDIIVQDIGCDISEEKVWPNISLLCFHNFCEDESPGSPFTRLVVEGKIQGKTYYWPMTVNRADEGKGIKNNTRHVFDLTIRRKGSTDPDTEVLIEDTGIIMEIEQWEEKGEYSVGF